MRTGTLFILAVTAAVIALIVVDKVARAAPLQGMTWDSIKNLPDFGGSWSLKLQPIPRPVLKPAPAAVFSAWERKTSNGEDPADVDGIKRSYCEPAHFSGFNGGLQDYVDFLFTPGRVTIINELGLIRRINLSSEPFREEPLETNTGVSIGHWEGRTLVVETRGLSHDIGWDEPRNHLPIRIGRRAHIIEHFSLIEPEILQIVTQISAPELLAVPYEVTTRYSRDRSHKFQEITNCVQNDRAFDDTTGRERLDLTPPADLPPPPSK
jgi:hypothetical protein